MPRDGTKTKQKILDAAQEQVLRQGFAGTSVDAIQDAAGISRGTFFYHFPSKDDLARALVARHAENDELNVDQMMARAENLASDPLQQALVFLGLNEEFFKGVGQPEAGCLFASFSYEAGLFDEETRSMILKSIDHWRRVFGGKLEEAIERHGTRIDDVDPYLLADVAYAIIQGAFILRRELDDADLMSNHVRQFRTHLELLFGTVGTDGPR